MDYQSFQPGGQEQSQVPTQPSPVQPTPRKTFTPKFIGIILIIVALGGGVSYGIWWWNRQANKQIVPTLNSQTNQATDWETYRDMHYWFQLKHPKNLRIEEWPTASGKLGFRIVKDGILTDTEDIQFIVHIGQRVNDLADWYGALNQVNVIRETDSMIDNARAINTKSDGAFSEETYLLKNGTIYEFRSSTAKKSLRDQMLATFKFDQPTDNSISYRDMVRYGNIHGIRVALELYKLDKLKYPNTLDDLKSVYPTTFVWTPFLADGTCLVDNFKYTNTNNGESYNLSFCLGQGVKGLDGFLGPGIHSVNPSGIK